jgi:hypothetical protein
MIRSLAISMVVMAWLAEAMPAIAQEVRTEGTCSPVVDRTQGAVTITYSGGCNLGIGPDQLREIIDSVLAKRAIPPELLDRYEALAQKYGVTDAALTHFFLILGEKQVATTDLDAKLREIAGRHLTLLSQATPRVGDDPQVAALKNKAVEEINAGHYVDAESLLQQASEADLAAVRSAREALDERLLGGRANEGHRWSIEANRVAVCGRSRTVQGSC